MCQFKSGIILKGRVFVPDYDSHTQMLKELGVEDNAVNAMELFVRAELIPANNDPFSDIGTWNFKVDQDILPDWFDPEEAKPRMIEAVKDWAKTHIYNGVDKLKIGSGSGYFLKDCTNVEVYDSATIDVVCGNATINRVYNNATIKAVSDSATIKAVSDSATIGFVSGKATIGFVSDKATIESVSDNATINRVYNNATIEFVSGKATIKSVYGKATINEVYGNATINRVCDKATIDVVYGNATINEVYNSATIDVVYGNATINEVYNSATINRVYNNATIESVSDNATIEFVYDNATINEVCDNATIITLLCFQWLKLNDCILKQNAIIIDRFNKRIYQTGTFTACIKTEGGDNEK